MLRASVLWGGLAAVAVLPTGCLNTPAEKVQGRSQIGSDEPTDPDAYATVGSKTIPDNMGPVHVSGVALVYRLAPGAGSHAPVGGWRTMLETSLKKQGWTNIRDILEDPAKTTSLVLVSAVIPPGARKGELLDVNVTVPDDSKTVSLRGGQLYPCELTEYDTTSNISATAKGAAPSGPPGRLLIGKTWARTVDKAAVVAGTYEAAERANPIVDGEEPTRRVGKVWAGARVSESRPYFYVLKAGDDNIRMAAEVAERLNATFHANGDPGRKVAEAQPKAIVVNVPHAYRHNHHRFLLVSRQVPMIPVAPGSIYREKLAAELLDPATCLLAAVKLEALGGDSRRPLRVGLESPSPWVRFAAAEALAYLGHTDGAEVLAKTVEEHPALRAHALKALAVTDDAACTDRLTDLLGNADPQVRYGAFIALRLADEQHPSIRGTLLNDSFHVHRVAAGSPGLVHVASDRRSEIVVFGDSVKLRGPFTLPLGSEFTVSVPANGPEAKVSRIVRVKGQPDVKEVTCPTDLTAVLATVARLGGGYGEAVELVRRADNAQVMTAALAQDAIPRQLSVQQLANFARLDPTLVKADVEVARVGASSLELEAAGVDLPADPGEARPADAPARAPLSRDPGRLFGPRQPAAPAHAEGLSPVVPTTATEPAPAAPRGSNPGTVFGR
ncbi:MAG: flagellar basal body P-ring protein FlgI [Gemmataceae bacterium]